jgi:hypothetical protein
VSLLKVWFPALAAWRLKIYLGTALSGLQAIALMNDADLPGSPESSEDQSQVPASIAPDVNDFARNSKSLEIWRESAMHGLWQPVVDLLESYVKWKPPFGFYYTISILTTLATGMVVAQMKMHFSFLAPFGFTIMFFFAYVLNFAFHGAFARVPYVHYEMLGLTFVGNLVGAFVLMCAHKFIEDRGGFGH